MPPSWNAWYVADEHEVDRSARPRDQFATVALSSAGGHLIEHDVAHNKAQNALSPRDTLIYVWMTHASMAKLHLGSFEQTVAWCRRAIEANRNYARAYFELAAALAQLGRIDEAQSAVQAGLALNPAFSISRVRATWTAMSDDPTYLAQLEPIIEGMRKAEVPEQ